MKNLFFLFLIPILFLSARPPVEEAAPNWTPEMIFVKGGSFNMGSSKTSEGHYSDEKLHTQSLSDYYIGKYEVTVADFAHFVEDTQYLAEAERGDGSVMKNYKSWWKKVPDANWRFDVKGKCG